MTIYQIENGKIIDYGFGESQSSDPSAFINRANDWASQGAGRRVIISSSRPKFPSGKARSVFLKVVGNDVEIMTPQEIADVEQAERDAKQTEKQNRKTRKREILTFFNVPANQKASFIRGLKELVEDGNDD